MSRRQILSAALMLRFSFNELDAASAIEAAVARAVDGGIRTGDIMTPGATKVGTAGMGDAILANLYDDNPTGIAEQVSYLIEIAVDSIRNTIAEQSRGRAAEVLVSGSEAWLIRDRERPADLFLGEHLLP